MPVESDAELRAILGLESIAVVGCSSTPGKDAYEIPHYMDQRGYDVIPVNPHADEILGREAYDSLAEVPAGVDVVDVFRPSEEVGEIADEVLARTDVGVVWTQLGIRDDEAARRIEASGRQVVQDRCLKIAHQRLLA
jgi:predicted CoA-binding protein